MISNLDHAQVSALGRRCCCAGQQPRSVGRGAIWRDEILRPQEPFCAYVSIGTCLRVRAVGNPPSFKTYFRSKAKGRRTLSSTAKEVEVSRLPLPTVPEQRDMIDQLFAGQAADRDEAAKARAKAWADFSAAYAPPS